MHTIHGIVLRWWAHWFAAINVTGVGNSLMAGFNGTTGKRWMQVHTGPLVPILIGFRNFGIGGISYSRMSLDAAAVDASWRPRRINILVVLEGTNDITDGSTGVEAVENLARYVRARTAINPWIVIAITSTIRLQDTGAYGPYDSTRVSHEILIHNELLRKNPGSYGVDHVIDLLGVGSPFTVNDPSDIDHFHPDYFSAGDADDARGRVRVHWTDRGFAYAGKLVADGVSSALRLSPRGSPQTLSEAMIATLSPGMGGGSGAEGHRVAS